MSVSAANHTCVYLNCKNTRKRKPDITFFKFPIKNEHRCEEWKKNCGNVLIEEMDLCNLKNKLVCEEHFSESNFQTSKRRKVLFGDAIPFCYKESRDNKNLTKKVIPYVTYPYLFTP